MFTDNNIQEEKFGQYGDVISPEEFDQASASSGEIHIKFSDEGHLVGVFINQVSKKEVVRALYEVAEVFGLEVSLVPVREALERLLHIVDDLEELEEQLDVPNSFSNSDPQQDSNEEAPTVQVEEYKDILLRERVKPEGEQS